MKLFRNLIIIFLCSLVLVGFSEVTFAATKTTSAKKTTISKTKTVKKTTTKKAVKKVPPKPKPSPYQAQLLIKSASELRLAPGETINLRLGYKNKGKNSWPDQILKIQNQDAALFLDTTWKSTSTPSATTSTLKSGRLEFYDFVLRAPSQPGDFVFNVALFVKGVAADGGFVSIPIEVAVPESDVLLQDNEPLKPEPRIRVSLGKISGAMAIKMVGDHNLLTLDKQPVFSLPDGSQLAWGYDEVSREYSASFNGATVTSTQPFRLEPVAADGRFIILDRQDKAAWNKNINYNEFRDTLELRWSDKIVGAWLVNELPFEYYLKGLIETGNSDPTELQKAIMTAARSYAYVNLPDGVKYAERLWDVHATWDQYYKGYQAEAHNPRGAAAVDATRGVVVTFDRHPVVTPYFTRSDGMTRGWKEVWGGQDKPWLKPVATAYDAGKKMWGHGVGMSTQDAKARAQKDNWTYEQILTYYYTGVQLKQAYN